MFGAIYFVNTRREKHKFWYVNISYWFLKIATKVFYIDPLRFKLFTEIAETGFYEIQQLVRHYTLYSLR